MYDPTVLPAGLPVPEDDGAADHLTGLVVPSVALPSTDGKLDLAELAEELLVLYVYPRTGRPGIEPPPAWDATPGARGCTPQSCGYRDHGAELRQLGARVVGVSAQSLDDQREAVQRLRLPHPVAADPELRLAEELRLPTFEFDGSGSTSGSRSSPRPAGSSRSSIPSSRRTRTRPTSWPGSGRGSHDLLDRGAGRADRRARRRRPVARVPRGKRRGLGAPGRGRSRVAGVLERSYGPLGLELLQAGKTPEQALAGLVAADPESGVRQVAMVDAEGRTRFTRAPSASPRPAIRPATVTRSRRT